MECLRKEKRRLLPSVILLLLGDCIQTNKEIGESNALTAEIPNGETLVVGKYARIPHEIQKRSGICMQIHIPLLTQK